MSSKFKALFVWQKDVAATAVVCCAVGSSKTSSSNVKCVWLLKDGVCGVDGVAGSQDVALYTEDSEKRRLPFFVTAFSFTDESLCDFLLPWPLSFNAWFFTCFRNDDGSV